MKILTVCSKLAFSWHSEKSVKQVCVILFVPQKWSPGSENLQASSPYICACTKIRVLYFFVFWSIFHRFYNTPSSPKGSIFAMRGNWAFWGGGGNVKSMKNQIKTQKNIKSLFWCTRKYMEMMPVKFLIRGIIFEVRIKLHKIICKNFKMTRKC